MKDSCTPIYYDPIGLSQHQLLLSKHYIQQKTVLSDWLFCFPREAQRI